MAKYFTPEQVVEIVEVVNGQCTAVDRVNAWHYNFGVPAHRGRAIHDLNRRAGSAIGCQLADMPSAHLLELTSLVMAVVKAYDERNNIPAPI